MFTNRGLTFALIVLAALAWQQLVASKIAYKKPIYGKTNYIKEKRYKLKGDPLPKSITSTSTTTTTTSPSSTLPSSTSISSSTSTAAPSTALDESGSVEFIIKTTPRAVSTAAVGLAASAAEASGTTTEATADEENSSGSTSRNDDSSITATTADFLSTTPSNMISTLPLPPTPAMAALPLVQQTPLGDKRPSNQPVPCTCGVFLSSQIHNGVPENPLILNELDRVYPCNPIGRKQCQTKCLEAIVQHLPNSANIVCGTLGHDCHKERAYLFIKNCQNQWWNTNLQAGREYCCKDGVPYRCPLLG
ncbi:follicle cell protein 3C-1 [Scaptodrosophila lebanonensis]|uniref:Follicle cell protein 3C-1 n=1 Tax=Drosophila lebanonensis TaxID=7225 RepID=A0A6J2TXZ7_DROLE|nr:follicle cell protein 3C-1 [Scaptodrosophila lebanonensis]